MVESRGLALVAANWGVPVGVLHATTPMRMASTPAPVSVGLGVLLCTLALALLLRSAL